MDCVNLDILSLNAQRKRVSARLFLPIGLALMTFLRSDGRSDSRLVNYLHRCFTASISQSADDIHIQVILSFPCLIIILEIIGK
jgi:hypothetical protein